MARRKNAPDLVKIKCRVAERLRELRTELFGDRGGPELARQLGLPVRTWYNYEAGVTVPAEVVLRLMELTSVEAVWLLHGTGPRIRVDRRADAGDAGATGPGGPHASVESLLRSALNRLERGEIPLRETPSYRYRGEDGAVAPNDGEARLVLVRVDDSFSEPLTAAAGPRYIAAHREWQAARRDDRCLRVTDDAMAPLVSAGAYVAYSDREVDLDDLDDRLVVGWIAGEAPVVRWFQKAGRFAMLRAENPAGASASQLVDLSGGDAGSHRFRVVSWISTPR